MNKLKLNKETISQMDKNEMILTNGGAFLSICLKSCPNGTRKLKACCMTDEYDDYTIA
ncbi:class I lanthipeptide [Aquimarina sp. W85]|uniref:class I lanthipeptide n=1 Tax=Aquimarina rhodophyticola TaxID=3342246 RepID=UPI00366DC67F